MSSIEKAMKRQGEKKKFGQKAQVDNVESEVNTGSQEQQASSPEASSSQASSLQAAMSASEQKKEQIGEVAETATETTAESSETPELAETPEATQASGTEDLEQEQPVLEPADDSLVPQSKDLVIDTEDLERQGFVALSKKRTLINEEFRSIKRKVLNNAFGPLAKTLNHGNLVLVSSSRPNEGKTFSAVNLALSIALEQDKTVLLVDADVLKPSVSKTLKVGKNVGLIEYLTGEVPDVGDVIYHTNIENLKLLPAGLPHHLSNELLSSDKMQNLFDEFATRYPDRIVVFDCPPLLGVNETALMAEQCGQGVIVVEELRSKVSEVRKAVSLLPEKMAVGFVLNKVIHSSTEDSYGYGYYYSTGE
jgi:protein-tyrosine kinase